MTEKFYKPAEGKLSIKGLFAQVLKGECSLQEFPDSILERVYVFKKEDVRQLSGNQNIVERMLNMSIPKSAKLGITGLFTILIFAVVLLPTTRADKLTVKTAEPNAVEIVEKVKSLYVGLDSYSSQGEASLSVNRLSETTEEDFKKAGINKKDFDDSINRYSLNGTFSVKLARPDYYIEWKKQGGDGVSLAGAVWSEGKQNFVYFDKWKVLSHNQLAALASARDYFNGAGTIIPFLFVPIGSDLLDLSKGVKREDDEIIDSDECYVITNSDMKYWISQKSFLIKKRQQVLRFEQIPLEISQDNAIQQMEYRGRPVTNETIRQYQEEYKAQCKLLSTMETVITEIHRNIIINQPIDFKPYISKYANVELTEPVKEKRKPRVISDVGKRSGEFSPEELASQVALEWLKLIDNGDYPESWEKTAEYFKAAIDKEQWNKSLLKERALLGKVISRKIKSKEYEFLKDMFYGEYIIIEFDTSFENKANVIEVTMLMLNENGSWQVCGYYIK